MKASTCEQAAMGWRIDLHRARNPSRNSHPRDSDAACVIIHTATSPRTRAHLDPALRRSDQQRSSPSRAGEEEPLSHCEMACPLGRSAPAKRGYARSASRIAIDEPVGSAQREAVLPAEIEHLHAPLGPGRFGFDPADEGVARRGSGARSTPNSLCSGKKPLPDVIARTG